MSDIEARLAVLEDAEAVRELCIAYGRTLDAKDFAGYASLFAEDGEWCGFETIKGRDNILRFMTETFDTPDAKPCVHLMTNFRIAVTADTATSWCRWTLIEDHGAGPVLVYSGHYDDEVVRTAQGWRFARRTVTVDIE